MRGTFAKPLLEGFHSKSREISLGSDPGHPFSQAAEQRILGKEVGQARGATGGARPFRDESKGVSRARTQPPVIIMREKLGLVSRHIHVHRAIPLAAFAGETEVE